MEGDIVDSEYEVFERGVCGVCGVPVARDRAGWFHARVLAACEAPCRGSAEPERDQVSI